MNAEQLNAIKERAAKATPGPWYSHADGTIFLEHTKEIADVWTDNDKSDAEFIAHAREDVPALVAEVERYHDMWNHGLGKADAEIQTNLHVIEAQQQEIERLRKALEFYADEENYECSVEYDGMGEPFAGDLIVEIDGGQTAKEALRIGEESNAL